MAGRRGRDVYRDPRWKLARDQVLFGRAGSLCEVCRQAPATAVHHKVRLTDGGEPFDPQNLIALCFWCHRDQHQHDHHGDPELRRKRQAWQQHVRRLFT